ncbi:hypothetical protein FQN55_004476 [Onygenales sp. PD_40]|nr:hypothetical protein FQN55_004476 [Onygenales sp. PD_40]KAK2781589.1 hypothetical protein FQN52_001445 [Onygenales sp. PD_12]
MATDHGRPLVPPRVIKTDYPVIDTDPHVKRVFGYARPSDYATATAAGAVSPVLFHLYERYHPVNASKGTYGRAMRLATAIGLITGVLTLYSTSCKRFYGFTENSREVNMDMREMVDKVKKGEPLYGESGLSPYMQGVAARNSRYSSLLIHVIPWFNFVNHNQHGVDTAKYYQQAERELELERRGSS